MIELMIRNPKPSLLSAERKRLGAFYTPENLSRILTDWAVRKPSDLILEPSFGGCGFLVAARRRLAALGASDTHRQIYGCDIDPGAFAFLSSALDKPVDTDRFRHENFLSLRAGIDWPHLFDATIGNPPYIPFQAIESAHRKELLERSEKLGVSLGGKSSLWAHFLIHAVSFVAPNGRMAWVLPGSFLQADYAHNVRKYLSKKFGSLICILMHQRFFKSEGTEEETVILLAKDRRETDCESQVRFVDVLNVDDLQIVVESWESGKTVGCVLDGRPSFLSVDPAVSAAYIEVASRAYSFSLEKYLKINIGLVTGANPFFVIDKNTLAENSLGNSSLVPVLAKYRSAKGLAFTSSDYEQAVLDGEKTYLVHASKAPRKNSALANYLQIFTEEDRNKVSTFKKRPVWHAPDDGRVPDAFFPVMNHNGPRLVLNEYGVTCTNTIHRAFFRNAMSEHEKKLLSISLLTSFSQLSAEFVGRRYGSGVLKHEPREAEKILVVMPYNISELDVDAFYSEIDALLRVGNQLEAHAKSDQLIFGLGLGDIQLANTFALALDSTRELRRTNRYRLGV